jgi:hypothetical protein
MIKRSEAFERWGEGGGEHEWWYCHSGLMINLAGNDQMSMLENFFPPSLMMRPNKLKGLPLNTLSSQGLEFEGKARANPIEGPFRCLLLGLPPGVTNKS